MSLPVTWWPMPTSTDATAFMPVPPTPMTCSERGCVRSMAEASATRLLLDQPGDPIGGVGSGRGAHRARHRLAPVG